LLTSDAKSVAMIRFHAPVHPALPRHVVVIILEIQEQKRDESDNRVWTATISSSLEIDIS